MNYLCPVCQGELVSEIGDEVDRTNGITLSCRSKQCPAQEVSGHGKNVKDAWEVIQLKFPAQEDRESTVKKK